MLNLLSLSTAHLTCATVGILEDDSLEDVSAYPKGAYGFFVFVPPFVYEGAPEDLARIFEYAWAHDVDWLMFDNGFDVIPELPVYDW